MVVIQRYTSKLNGDYYLLFPKIYFNSNDAYELQNSTQTSKYKILLYFLLFYEISKYFPLDFHFIYYIGQNNTT